MSGLEQRIQVEQARVGLYIHLEGWADHPFLFSSFKIRNEKQLQVLRSLGMSHVLYDPARSDQLPLPPPLSRVDAPAPAPQPVDPEVEAMWAAKQARREKLAAQREAMGRCDKKFSAGVATVHSLLRNLFSRPDESLQQAHALVSDMVDSMLNDKDVVLHLMNAKSGDEGTYYHALNVTVLALIVGKEAKLDAAAMRALGLGTLLHDLGKEKVPSQIRLKKTPWTAAERNFYQMHVAYGLEMLQQLPGVSAAALEVVAKHHELLDGSGFPGKLRGEQIGRLARIACITNSFDNYCNAINPAESMTPAEALSFMFKYDKGKFDPDLMQLFVRCMGVYPPGSVVQLSNGQTGLVMSVNAQRLLQPSLLVYDPDVPKDEALWLDLSVENDLTVVKTLRPQELCKAVLDYLDPRTRISYYTENARTPSRTGRGA
ncbi:MAG: HD-GYP domain-containing protein [Gammaproteobacteria bacterium]|nr:HD-GYP domain-containing protein [Gammaproteobacteria bacterium]